MSTDVRTTEATRAEVRDRVFLAVVLLTAGGVLLIDRLTPGWPLGDAAALVVGLELLVWAFRSRAAGVLVAGGILTGIGTGIVLAAGPLQGHDAAVVGGTWLSVLGAGFALVAGLARLLGTEPQDWAWIPAGCLVALGAAVGSGATASVVAWAGPVVLLGTGAWLLLRRSR